MLKCMPFSAVLLAGGALALGGMPPFNIFLSEFMTVTAGLAAGHITLTIVLLLLLTVVLAGLVRMAASVLFGDKPEEVNKGELGILTTLPMLILLILMLVMGTHIPQPVSRLLENAVHIVMNNKPGTHAQPLSWPWAVQNHSSAAEPQAGEVK
jgi:hydrogenase-4 component F